MNFFDSHSVWQADNLPDGLTIKDGVISGTPTTRGTYTVPVTVTNSLGSDTKNITITVKGRNDCAIMVNGGLTETLTPAELQAIVQDGTAQSKYNCSQTQMIIPVADLRSGTSFECTLNFCDFRNVTLQDGTTKTGLILQFAYPLWRGFAPFDSNGFNRWKYSNLRQWLNSSGIGWFSKAYASDALTSRAGTYSDSGISGFLDCLPQGITELLQPVKVITQAFFDDENTDLTIDDPEDLDGLDGDVTYDKVFIPSLSEMNISADGYEDFPEDNFEGTAWAVRPANQDLDGNNCLMLTRSALISGKNKIIALQNFTPVVSDTFGMLLAPAPAFVIC